MVPVVPQFLAVTGVKNLIAAAERAAWDNGTRVRALGLLLTMVDYRTKSTRRTVDELRAEHGSLVFAIEIRVNTRLAEAPDAGQTIFQYDRKAKGPRPTGCWRRNSCCGRGDLRIRRSR